MLSESARMSSSAEARFRVQASNSKPRSIKVIALDVPSEVVVRRLAEASWSHATFFTAHSTEGSLSDLGGHTRDLLHEVYTGDLVVLVAAAGGTAQAASVIGEACSLKGVMTTALIVGASSVSDEALSRTLAPLRPWSLMVVIASSDDYIEDMLTALRA